jgi:hypothetical protein
LERVAVADDQVGSLSGGQATGAGRAEGGGRVDGGRPDGLAFGQRLLGLQSPAAGSAAVDGGAQVVQRIHRPARVVGAERQGDPGPQQQPGTAASGATASYHDGGRGRPRAQRLLTDMNDTRRRLYDLFGLDRYAPTR